MIREEVPAKPSTIDRTVRGDVETITLKALEKDRERRYRSVEAFADDVRHYLRNEPIQAWPASLSYQFNRFARRNRAVVIGIAAVFLVLVGGIVATGFALSRALTAEKAESDARIAAVEAKAEESRQRKKAQEERDTAQQERDTANREREATAYQAYLANIATAEAALLGADYSTARRRLKMAPEAFRNWEWQFLLNQCDVSVTTL